MLHSFTHETQEKAPSKNWIMVSIPSKEDYRLCAGPCTSASWEVAERIAAASAIS